MTFSNTFRVVWWFLIALLLSIYLFDRYDALAAGKAVLSDVVVFLVWTALLLVPVFHEFTVLGLTFKQQVDKLREETKEQFDSLRQEVRQAVEVKTNVTNYLNSAPPPDHRLPEIESQVRKALDAVLAERGPLQLEIESKPSTALDEIDDRQLYLIKTRLKLEKEIRRLADSSRGLQSRMRRRSMSALLEDLVVREIIEPELVGPIRDLYSVCSAATHSEPVTDAQFDFVRDVGPQVILALRALG